ncbi:hypothetical protein DR864_05350 [Runella rosea]|uniref:DUF4440 domain-containing protein n=1 Tax=Runella rosea TaxID=2259595 RepID=A0A344TEY0_9BACT|nr:nuclear transport factor 2 family protein [Runella rosea]AXE17201.1 hypothetical protein DR864_05350 [Runella rosea]
MKPLRYLTLTFLLMGLVFVTACAQKPIQKLIDTEKQFAAYTSTHSIKEGFLMFLDSTGVVFNQGKVLNGMDFYQKAPAKSPVLFWEPSFSVISTSGDLGVNTGPYTVRATPKDSVIARGNFSSIWKKNNAGEFKLLIDLGNSYTETHAPVSTVNEIILQKSFSNASYNEIMVLEESINQAITSQGWRSLSPYIHPSAHFNLPAKSPVITQKQVLEELSKLSNQATLKALNGGISKAGDFAYVYGSVTHSSKTTSYLRVWIKDKNDWKLILLTLD